MKDYNSELEEILDRKYFSSNIKNLLLSMIYKIENSYNDYEKVKRIVRTKEEFLNELVESINKYCDNVKVVEPDSKGAEILEKNKVMALTNEKERSLLAYPTENALLYAISDIAPKYFYLSNDLIFKKLIQDMLVEGYNTNNLEILVNFNGWSWDTKSKSNGKYINNLIYQNFLFLVGEGFLKEWRTTSSNKINYFAEIESRIQTLDKGNEFLLYMCKILYAKANEKEKEILNIKLKEKIRDLSKIKDKDKFLTAMQMKKMKLNKELQKIDLILNDDKILAREFKKRNSKLEDDKKIGSIKIYYNMLLREKEKAFAEFKEASDLSLPVNYLKYKDKLERYEFIYKNKNGIDKDIIELEKCFLKLMEKKTLNAMTNAEIIDIIYILRYLKNININKDYQIKDIPSLNRYIDKILKIAITKACKSGIIKIISMDISTNYEIIKFAIDSMIIELEEIKIYLELDKDNLTIKVYDKEIYEKEITQKFTGDKKDFEIKLKKMVKIFN
jgi:hypothetical protein